MAKKSKEVSEETFSQLEDLCNEPAAPTEALKELMAHKKEKTFCPYCGGTGWVAVAVGQLESCVPCGGTGLVVRV